MDFITGLFSNLNLEVIFQLIFLTLILVSGPVVIFLLAFNKGDL